MSKTTLDRFFKRRRAANLTSEPEAERIIREDIVRGIREVRQEPYPKPEPESE